VYNSIQFKSKTLFKDGDQIWNLCWLVT